MLAAADGRDDRPVLGICLGMQLMGLHRGGALDQHLPETLDTSGLHWPRRTHDIAGLGHGWRSIGPGSASLQMLGGRFPSDVVDDHLAAALQAVVGHAPSHGSQPNKSYLHFLLPNVLLTKNPSGFLLIGVPHYPVAANP